MVPKAHAFLMIKLILDSYDNSKQYVFSQSNQVFKHYTSTLVLKCITDTFWKKIVKNVQIF